MKIDTLADEKSAQPNGRSREPNMRRYWPICYRKQSWTRCMRSRPAHEGLAQPPRHRGRVRPLRSKYCGRTHARP